METFTEKLQNLIVEAAQAEIEEYLARNAMDVMQIGSHVYTRDCYGKIVFVDGNLFYDVRTDIEGLAEDADIAAMEKRKTSTEGCFLRRTCRSTRNIRGASKGDGLK